VAVSMAYTRVAYGPATPDTWSGLFNGDDSVVVMSPTAHTPLPEVHDVARRMGLTVDVKETRSRSDIEFCQLLPYPTADGTVWGPKIGRILPRLGWAVTAEHSDVYGAAHGLLDSCWHVPFIRSYLLKTCELAKPGRPVKHWFPMIADRRHAPSGETWAFIHERYGLSTVDHEHLQTILAGVSVLPSLVTWEPIEAIARRDAS
jgi:hypothetical protein